MNIFELDNHNLAESAKFKDSLIPTIWDRHENLTNAVREQIMIGAEEYCSYLGLSESQVRDIIVAGRSAGYEYSLNETIDVVVVADLNPDPTFREFFNENKYRYNRQHPVQVGEQYVRFYVQPSEEPLVSRGAYSVLRESWIQVPVRRNILANDTVVMLREAERKAQPIVKAAPKKKKIIEARKPVVYGYGEDEIVTEDVGMSPGGVSPSTKMFLSEEPKSAEEVLQDFIEFCSERLELENVPNFKVKRDPEWSKRNKTFGRFNQMTGILEVSIANRHLMDVCRTVAHELVHQRQAEIAPMPAGAGDTGSDHENEANALAGVLMRDYGQAHPELFAGDEELEEGWKQKAAAAAMSAALLGGAGAAHGQSVQGALGGAADVARATQTMKGVNWGGMLGGEAQNAMYQYSQTDLPRQLAKMKKQDAPQQQYQNDNGDWSGNSDYKRNNPAFQPESIQEDASGYIPTKKQAKDPRYEMALTVDVKPGTLGKVANAYKLNTDSQGRPQVAKANGMVQRMKEALELYKKKSLVENIEGFHGSFNKNITSFQPLTHFGSKDAAATRLVDKAKKEKLKDAGDVYQVELDIKNPAPVKDFNGNHSPSTFAFHLKDNKIITQDEMMTVTQNSGQPEAATNLIKLLKSKGYDGMYYKNRWEDKGHTSYVILDPSQARIVKKEPVISSTPVTESKGLPAEVQEVINSLTPADTGMDEVGNYRVHYEGFTDDCKLSSDYKRDPEAVYQQVFNDFISREGDKKPIASGMVGDKEYPILYSVFKVPKNRTVDTADRAYEIAYNKRQPWPKGSREEQLIRSDWQLSGLYDKYILNK